MPTAKTAAPAATKPTTAIVRPGDLPLANIEDLLKLSSVLYKAGISKALREEQVAAIVLMGREVGLSPVQACQNIMTTNGRMTIWGDALLALVRRSGLLEKFEESIDGTGDDRTAKCVVKRLGDEKEVVVTFSMADARKAKLLDKSGTPWQTYPDRMLKMRARSWALRDNFTDVLCGLTAAEEAADEPEVKVVDAKPAEPAPAASPVDHGTNAAPAPGPTTTPAAKPAVNGELMVTDDQLRAFAKLKSNWLRRVHHIGGESAAAGNTQWKILLGKWGVESAKQLTAQQAHELYNEIRDPAQKLDDEAKAFF